MGLLGAQLGHSITDLINLKTFGFYCWPFSHGMEHRVSVYWEANPVIQVRGHQLTGGTDWSWCQSCVSVSSPSLWCLLISPVIHWWHWWLWWGARHYRDCGHWDWILARHDILHHHHHQSISRLNLGRILMTQSFKTLEICRFFCC